MGEQVSSVRRDIDFQPYIVEPEDLHQRSPDLGSVREKQDPRCIVAETKLASGTEHSLGVLAADLRPPQGNPTRQLRADAGERIYAPLDDSRRAANHLVFGLAICDTTQREAIGVRVPSYAEDAPGDDALDSLSERMNGVDRGTCTSQAFRELRGVVREIGS